MQTVMTRCACLTYALFGAATALPLSMGAVAQDVYPSKPIKLVVPSSAGGVHDIIGRLWAEAMKSALGTMVIDNRGGAGGVIGVTDVARAPADGYTLLLGSNGTHILTPLIWKSSGKTLQYDPIKDFSVITVFAGIATAIAVDPALPARNLQELISYARANVGKLTYAHGGVGGLSHVAGEMFKQLAGGLDIRPVAYRGMGPAQADVINGNVSLFLPNVTGQVVELHQTGKIRLLALNSATRHPKLPDVATAAEAGLPGMITQNFFAIFAPAGTPQAIVDRVNEASRQALTQSDFRSRLAVSAFDAIPGLDAAQSTALVSSEHVRWDQIIKVANIRE